MVGGRGFLLADDAPFADGFIRREKTRRVVRQVMVSVASIILLLTPPMGDAQISQRCLSPQAGGNHWMESNAALPVRLPVGPGVLRDRSAVYGQIEMDSLAIAFPQFGH